MLLCLVTGIVLLTIRCCPQVEGRSVSKMSEIKDVLDFFTDTYAESSTYTNVKFLGCFKDKTLDRALRKHFFSADKSKGHIVKQCAEKAKEDGFNVFGVQYYHECWADKEDESRYSIYGKEEPCSCPQGIGKGDTNAVYRVEAVCHANGVNYTEGKQMTIPNKYDNIEDATCQHCLCVSGKPSECRSIHCDLGKGRSWCEKYGSVPGGECCPKCECLHNGQRMPEGSSWTIRRSDGRCAECKCVEGRGNCKLKSVLCPVCEKPIPADDQCCDICPKPTTTTPTVITFILPTTKARPIFTFPPRPRGLRRHLVRYGDLNIE